MPERSAEVGRPDDGRQPPRGYGKEPGFYSQCLNQYGLTLAWEKAGECLEG